MKYDFEAALEFTNNSIETCQKVIDMKVKHGEDIKNICDYVDMCKTIRFALALADIVTGEPTDEMNDAFNNSAEIESEYLDAYHSMHQVANTEEVIKAMISEAVKLAEEKAGV